MAQGELPEGLREGLEAAATDQIGREMENGAGGGAACLIQGFGKRLYHLGRRIAATGPNGNFGFYDIHLVERFLFSFFVLRFGFGLPPSTGNILGTLFINIIFSAGYIPKRKFCTDA